MNENLQKIIETLCEDFGKCGQAYFTIHTYQMNMSNATKTSSIDNQFYFEFNHKHLPTQNFINRIIFLFFSFLSA